MNDVKATRMNSIAGFGRKKWKWAAQNKLFWANLMLGIVAIAIIFIFRGPEISGNPSDFRIRFYGMFLQLLGAYTVWHNLTGTAQEFGETGLVKRNWEWFKAGFRSKPVILKVSGVSAGSSISSGRIRVRSAIDPDTSIEHRISVLERYVGQIDLDLAAAYDRIDTKTKEVSDRASARANELKAAIIKTERQLKNAMIGNYSVLLFGAVWLFVGIVLASLAPEIAKIVGGDYKAVWAAF